MRVALLAFMQGKYDEAKPRYERALRIREGNLGEDHSDVAASLASLANLLKDQVLWRTLLWPQTQDRRAITMRPSHSTNVRSEFVTQQWADIIPTSLNRCTTSPIY